MYKYEKVHQKVTFLKIHMNQKLIRKFIIIMLKKKTFSPQH